MEKPSSRFNLISQSVLVTCICLCGAIFSSVLLYRDIQSIGSRKGSPIAKLEQTEFRVRLKPANSFVWAPAHSNEDLYVKDSVQTPEDGGAAVRFNDGTILELGENSLVVIDQLSNLSLNFIHGSAILRTQSGDSRITLDESGKAKVEKLPIRLLKPEALSEILSEKSSYPVHFQWELASASAHELTLQVASDRKFKSSDLKTFKLPGATSETTLELPEGRYFWRVVGEDAALVAPSRFQVEAVQALKPLAPSGAQTLTVSSDADNVEFNWTAPPEGAAINRFSSRIEVSASSDFKRLVASPSIAAESGTAQIRGLPEGALFWRIASTYHDTSQGARVIQLKSGAEKFALEKLKKAQIALSQPSDRAKVEITAQTAFSWSSDASGIDYQLELRSKDSAGKSFKSPGVRTNRVELSRLSAGLVANGAAGGARVSAGIYEWRVQGFVKEKLVGETGWRDVTFYEGSPPTLNTPLAHQEFRYWKETPQFDLTWSEDAQVKQGDAAYLVELSHDPDFKQVQKIESKTAHLPSQSVKWAEGDQYWRVSVVNLSKEILKTSSTGQFYYGTYPPLRAPASIEPKSGSLYNPLEQEKPLLIRWAAVDNAANYILTVKLGEKIVFEKSVEKPQYEVKGLKPGKYAFSVVAVDVLKRRGDATGAQEFEVTYGDTLEAPEATSPEVQ